MPNTRIYYSYRNGCNYKIHNEVVEGFFTEDEMRDIMAICEVAEMFIPTQVGFPRIQFDDKDTTDGHAYIEAFEETSAEPTIDVTAYDVYIVLMENAGQWK